MSRTGKSERVDSNSNANTLLNEAEQLIQIRSRTGHVYTSSRSQDDELYSWFRGRWPLVCVNEPTAGERELRDPDWWREFNQHFEGRVHNMTEMVILQRDVSKPLGAQGNFCFVPRGVRLAIEICRSRE